MNEQATCCTIRILERIVTVIPGMTILGGSETVGVCLICGDGALGHAIDSISLISVELTDTVPMDGGSIGCEIVGDVHGNVITPTGFNQGTWISTIDHFTGGLEVSVRRNRSFGDIDKKLTVDALRP